jgi:hypothetical protein
MNSSSASRAVKPNTTRRIATKLVDGQRVRLTASAGISTYPALPTPPMRSNTEQGRSRRQFLLSKFNECIRSTRILSWDIALEPPASISDKFDKTARGLLAYLNSKDTILSLGHVLMMGFWEAFEDIVGSKDQGNNVVEGGWQLARVAQMKTRVPLESLHQLNPLQPSRASTLISCLNDTAIIHMGVQLGCCRKTQHRFQAMEF